MTEEAQGLHFWLKQLKSEGAARLNSVHTIKSIQLDISYIVNAQEETRGQAVSLNHWFMVFLICQLG